MYNVLCCRYYHDITTCTPEGETMYNADGTVVESKLRVLSRTYPQFTAGTLKGFQFDTASAHFSMTYTPLPTLSPADKERRSTVIYYNQELHYQNRGVQVQVQLSDDAATAEDVFAVRCSAANQVTIVQTAAYQGDATVTVSRCKGTKCTCSSK
jgi:hypothetical protein